MFGSMIKMNVKSCDESRENLLRNDNQLSFVNEWIRFLNDYDTRIVNRTDGNVTFDISNISSLLRRTSALCQVGINTSQSSTVMLGCFSCRLVHKRHTGRAGQNIVNINLSDNWCGEIWYKLANLTSRVVANLRIARSIVAGSIIFPFEMAHGDTVLTKRR